MTRSAFVEAFSCVNHDGIRTATSRRSWESDQAGPEDIKRQQVLASPHVPFGKLHLPDKLTFSAAAALLEGVENVAGDRTATCFAVPYGSLSTDMLYVESLQAGFPSPAIFSATLPSSPLAEVAIFYGIKGPNRVFAGGCSPGLAALDSALGLLDGNKADEVIFICAWALGKDARLRFTDGTFLPNAACGLLLSRNGNSGAMRLRLECAESGDEPAGDNEQELFFEVIDFLARKKQTRIPVSAEGYYGNIFLELGKP